MALTPTAQRWARLVAAFERSNSTAAAFAAQHGVNPSTLMWWRSRLRTGAISGGFVPVELPVVVAQSQAARPLRLEFVSRGVALAIPDDTDLAWLRSVVDALT